MAELHHTQGPQADFSPGPDCYQRCQDWKEECELLIQGPLASKNNAVKASYIMLWAGKTGRTHIKSLNLAAEERGDPAVLLQKFEEWTKPKANELAAAAAFRRLEQGNLTLAEYIDRATVLCDQCNYPDDARDRLLRDALVIGLRSREAYFKCIEKGSALTLDQAKEIAQNEEATCNQVGYMRPEFKATQATVHKLTGKKGPKQHRQQQQSQQQGQQKQKHEGSKRKKCFSCGGEPSHPKSECPAKKAKCFKCGKEGHYGNVCRTGKHTAKVHEIQAEANQLTAAPGGYEPVYFTQVHQLATVKIKSLSNPAMQEQIRPLWLSKGPGQQVFQIDCEVDTAAGCSVIPLYKAKALFGDNLKLGPPSVYILGYDDNPVKNLGSLTMLLYKGNTPVQVLCEVTDTKGHMILGRHQSLKIGYVNFPEIQAPNIPYKKESSTRKGPETSIKKVTTTRQEAATEPVVPVIQQSTDSSITINGKTQQLPTSKEYLLKEYADVFDGIGTLPGGAYHIQLKDGYKPVQHAPRTVAQSLKPAYREELDRLLRINVIAEVREYTEWVNSIVPAKKPDGTLRLCLDPKDLNKEMKRDKWYTRTMDDVLPELAGSKFFSLLDAKSGFWHIPLDHESSMLTTFNTPWGKFRWLRLPFGLTVSGDVFQERLDRVLRSIPNTTGIADDVLSHGKTATAHDAAVITLLETARANNLTFNAKKFVFRSQDCPFFGGNLTSDGFKVDPKKVKAITEMSPPTNLQELQSYLGLVNYLNRFSGKLADLSAPLRELCKQDVIYTWGSPQQKAFEAIKKEITNAPILAYFDKDKKSIIQADASKKGLGAVLLQDGKPVVYASRSLTGAEERYSNIERELLATVFAMERLHNYVYGYTVTVQTDHQPLVSCWKKSIAANSPRLQRLLLRLSQYDINIEYLKGKENVIADALSRVSPLPPDTEEKHELDIIPVHMLTEEIPADAGSIADFRQATQEDTTSGLLMQAVMNGWPASRKDCHPLLLEYWTYREEISAENGLLFKGHRLIVPESMRNRALQTIHAGHFGQEKMQLRARESVFWPKITADILQTAQTCTVCQTFSRSQQRETLIPHEVPQGPWEKLGIDFFEFNSCNYLMIADYYSRFPVIRRVRSTTTTATVDTLKQVFSEYGVPKLVMSDNGPQFGSKEFASFSKQWCFTHITSSPRYPQSNGLVERMIQTTKQCLKKCAAASQDPYLAMLIYRATPLTNSIPAPAELLNGRKFRALLPTRSIEQTAHSQMIRDQMIEDKTKVTQSYNQAAKDLPPLSDQQKVYVQIDPAKPRWTPAKVTQVPGSNQPRSYQVETIHGSQLQRNRRFIKPAEGPSIPPTATPSEPSDATGPSRPRRQIRKPERLIETI